MTNSNIISIDGGLTAARAPERSRASFNSYRNSHIFSLFPPFLPARRHRPLGAQQELSTLPLLLLTITTTQTAEAKHIHNIQHGHSRVQYQLAFTTAQLFNNPKTLLRQTLIGLSTITSTAITNQQQPTPTTNSQQFLTHPKN
jgi:hypothetical protein